MLLDETVCELPANFVPPQAGTIVADRPSLQGGEGARSGICEDHAEMGFRRTIRLSVEHSVVRFTETKGRIFTKSSGLKERRRPPALDRQCQQFLRNRSARGDFPGFVHLPHKSRFFVSWERFECLQPVKSFDVFEIPDRGDSIFRFLADRLRSSSRKGSSIRRRSYSDDHVP